MTAILETVTRIIIVKERGVEDVNQRFLFNAYLGTHSDSVKIFSMQIFAHTTILVFSSTMVAILNDVILRKCSEIKDVCLFLLLLLMYFNNTFRKNCHCVSTYIQIFCQIQKKKQERVQGQVNVHQISPFLTLPRKYISERFFFLQKYLHAEMLLFA